MLAGSQLKNDRNVTAASIETRELARNLARKCREKQARDERRGNKERKEQKLIEKGERSRRNGPSIEEANKYSLKLLTRTRRREKRERKENMLRIGIFYERR